MRLGSVRLNDGGSASFVSPNGLIITNQHVASGQLSKMSSRDKDYIKDGFYARTSAEEARAADLEANVLISYEDVTSKVQTAAKSSVGVTFSDGTTFNLKASAQISIDDFVYEDGEI